MSRTPKDKAHTAATNTPTSGRKYKVTPTPRQRRAARIMADIAMGKRTDIKNSGQIVVEAGYSPATEIIPGKLLNTIGVDTALHDLGFTPENAKRVVNQILNSDKAMHRDRLKAAEMVFKVHGSYAAEKHVNVNVDVQADDSRLLELAERLRNSAK